MHRASNLDFLRVAAAFAVLVGHAYVLTTGASLLVLGVPLESLAVAVFFVMSGWLITLSWTRSPRVGSFLAARALRIFPGLAVVVLVSILVIGPLFTSLPLELYLSDPSTWSYLTNIVLWKQDTLPGVFTGSPVTPAVNGSLWTLAIEFSCYLIVPLIGLLSGPLRIAATAVIAVAGIVGYTVIPYQVTFLIFPVSLVCLNVSFFAAGALAAHVSGLCRTRAWLRVDVGLLAIVLQLIILAMGIVPPVQIAWAVIPYAVLAFGLARTPVVHQASRLGDFSYGTYLWAFPLQQIVIALGPPRSILQDILVVTAATLVAAVLSWYLVERPALALKPRRRPPAARDPFAPSAVPMEPITP